MSFQTPITVKEVVQNIHNKKYLLPAIQREVVWKPLQIQRLFDSLMRDYPIGSFLFWDVDKGNTSKYQFYEFVREYHEKDNRHNPKADISGNEGIIGILDGQQRFTSLYIGLKGSYAYKEPRKRWDNPEAFPRRKLYLNLFAEEENRDNTDMIYSFYFLTEEDEKFKDGKNFWFRVGEILDLKEQWEVNEYLINNGLTQRSKEEAIFANRTLFKLWSVIHEKKIVNYFLEKDQSLDKVLNIFIRVNSGGTTLSYSDLLLSVATAQWQNRDAREEITSFVDDLNRIGEGFNFDKDFVLKSSLVISDIKDIAFKVDNFDKSNMLKIEQEWPIISNALNVAVILISTFGYSRETLTANYPIIPIAYYLKKKNIPKHFDIAAQYFGDRKAIQKWLILALVKRVFGGISDSVIRVMREILNEPSNDFPLDRIIARFRRTEKSLTITEDDIENLLCFEYGQGYTFSTLALLYPSFDFRNRFHIDHIHPKSHFTKDKLRKGKIPETDWPFYIENVNALPNLQLLEGIPNQEKSYSDFSTWVETKYPSSEARTEYMKRHFIPETDLSLSNFRDFFEKRKEILKNELRRILG